jgi:hypothetical protein
MALILTLLNVYVLKTLCTISQLIFVLYFSSCKVPRIFCVKQLMRLNVQVSDKNYAVAGDILDGYLYDLFMNMLGQ